MAKGEVDLFRSTAASFGCPPAFPWFLLTELFHCIGSALKRIHHIFQNGVKVSFALLFFGHFGISP